MNYSHFVELCTIWCISRDHYILFHAEEERTFQRWNETLLNIVDIVSNVMGISEEGLLQQQ